MSPIEKPTTVAHPVENQHFGTWQRQHMRWIVAALIAPLGMTLTAYGVVEFGPQAQINIHTVTQTLATPPLISRDENQQHDRMEVIRSGDTVGRILSRMGIMDQEVQKFIQTDATAKKLYELSPGRILHASSNENGEISQLTYVNGAGEQVRISRTANQLSASSEPVATQKQTFMKSGRINSSFFAATDAADIPDAITQQLIDLFASRVDFHHKLQKGDQFSVVYESEVHLGAIVRPGRILAAQFINNGNVHEAMWFADGSENGNYYSLDGRSLKQGFISNPVKFSRISSGFAMRLHPVLFTWKQHRGVDYAAPTGTDIQVTADGIVTKAGRDGGYGNFVEVKHDGKYSTLYGHMSAIAKGLKAGQAVSQGQVIGAVGQTGRATGPHLHYEFKVNGQQVDPLTVAMPEGKKLSTQQLADFAPLARTMKRQLSVAGQVELAQLD
ncbi:peptidoglycan DD-metalloendopeptidase family protein [Chitinibacter bivalviorum]|uniref:Peptidoglycan DD-metalloendopeptidase family protein n=1 Tax=Chitinibacter bivalviorum TaxID=2739434 RepID=A0A7H9BHE6_9NEIS|nr:peptidoglycan DD-metalloendopeptidase family protein [Chitinibacter bivalviorum]QLG87686.1 peptidoglycan DD-metalloendopeptidase family protein [Chitinibacter bivalviorum]